MPLGARPLRPPVPPEAIGRRSGRTGCDWPAHRSSLRLHGGHRVGVGGRDVLDSAGAARHITRAVSIRPIWRPASPATPRVSHSYAVSQGPKEGNRRLEWSSCLIPLLPLDEQLRELELDFVEISGRCAAEMEREGVTSAHRLDQLVITLTRGTSNRRSGNRSV